MPDQATLRRVKRDRREGKSASTQAGEFVKQEMDHIREGKHGARSAKQAIAIGLSEARRAGVKVPASKATKKSTRRKAAQDTAAGRQKRKPSTTRSRATKNALKREPRRAASKTALSRQAHRAASKRTATSRSAAARKAARTRARARR
jgi:hypothetical protein